MNYTEITNELRKAASKVHNINSFNDDDIYTDWNRPNIRFSALNVYLQSASRTDNTIQYTIMVYYGDRLTVNMDNRNSIFDDGINAILTVLENLPDELTYEVPVVFTPFEQQFADQLAGVYCQVVFETEYEIGKCGLELIP